MADDTWQITCINKDDRYNPRERIQSVGGREGGGWKLPVDQVIRLIQQGKKFWVSAGGKSVWVVVATKDGRPYIKTQNDGDEPNNLLSLPECR